MRKIQKYTLNNDNEMMDVLKLCTHAHTHTINLFIIFTKNILIKMTKSDLAMGVEECNLENGGSSWRVNTVNGSDL